MSETTEAEVSSEAKAEDNQTEVTLEIQDGMIAAGE